MTSLKITHEEFQERALRLLEEIRHSGLRGVVLFDNYYILYYTGFAFIPTERPIAFVMNDEGEKAVFVPLLEAEHASADTGFERVEHYGEYPGTTHPMDSLKKLLLDMRILGPVAADYDGYPWILGYRGPKLSALTGHAVHDIRSAVEDQMMIKSPAEIALIRESVRWGNLAHRLLQRYTRVGATETEVSWRASNEATLAMLDTLGDLYEGRSVWENGAGAGYRGQIGRNAAIPHALANNIAFQPGDVLVTGASAPVWGYTSEVERTMIIAPVSDEQKRLFDHMVELQDIAFDALRHGGRCCDVDGAVRNYYEDAGLTRYWKHHSGHSIGLRYHEGPFLDIGDQTELKPGMVFTVEPGLYAPEVGGFRHSDTVVITEGGIDILTYYPRDLDSLTIR